MRVIYWNVHLAISENKYAHIAEMSPDILILAECSDKDYEKLKRGWKYKNLYKDDLNGEYSPLGIAIFSNIEIEMCEKFNRNS